MRQLRTILTLAGMLLAGFVPATAQQQPGWEIQALTPEGGAVYDLRSGIATGTNGVLVKYGGAVLTAERVTVNQTTGETAAEGRVRIQQGDQIWAGESIRYNFLTRQMQAEQFRTGKAPVFAAARGLHGDITNQTYSATNAFITTDDISHPTVRIHANYIRIVPGERIEARHAMLYVGDVPVFYFPFFVRRLDVNVNRFSVIPGYRSRYGPFLLGSYHWYLNEYLDGEIHLDYRLRRGVGTGPDVNYHLGRWGDGSISYYYLHDLEPDAERSPMAIPADRHRAFFSYNATPFTNLNVKSMVRYQSDIRVLRDFFESEYRRNPQPSTFFEVNKFWDNFSLDVYAQPRINDFFETVERLPDVRLTGFRQQIGGSPLYYESESSVGYYRRLFAETNGPTGLDFSAARADTYHQVLLPRSLFGWLNVTPRVGGRFTYYSEAHDDGAMTDEVYRGVFNTGAEVSFKASQLWPGVQNKWLEVDGIRHIVEPSANYVFVPTPNRRPPELPHFDYELPSLRLLPIDYPDYNAIDSIDSQNVVRFGLRNRLQTKRGGQLDDLAYWDVYTDWRLNPRSQQTTFADLYSDLVVRPRSWLTLESLTRMDIHDVRSRLAFHTLTIQPNNVWSWSLGHFYVREDLSDDPQALGAGNNLVMSSVYYRLNENWGFRATHHFEVTDGRMEEQYYTVYRDWRSWTSALTFRVREHRDGPDDFTVAFTFSLKAAPRTGVGGDTIRPYSLLGR